ncbi:26064_t:CDS:2, partial [Gigaspora rosea]
VDYYSKEVKSSVFEASIYFLNENINSHDKLTAQEMYYSFQEFVLSEE